MPTATQALLLACANLFRPGGAHRAYLQAIAITRCLAFPRLLGTMLTGGHLRRVAERRLHNGKAWDPLHFVSHRGYLVRDWPLERRFRAALYYYRNDAEAFHHEYVERLEDPRGVTLWSCARDGHAFDLRLIATDDYRREGDLSVQMRVDGVCVGCMGFVWADAALFGEPPGRTLFVTRSQTLRVPGLDVFRASFPQNSPPYLCFAALCAIASLDGMTALYAIRHERQLSFTTAQERGFKHSYTEFWEKFGGRPIDPYALQIALPVHVKDLGKLRSSHRGRAERRRALWADVSAQTQEALAPLRRARTAPTIRRPGHSVSTSLSLLYCGSWQAADWLNLAAHVS